MCLILDQTFTNYVDFLTHIMVPITVIQSAKYSAQRWEWRSDQSNIKSALCSRLLMSNSRGLLDPGSATVAVCMLDQSTVDYHLSWTQTQ